MKVHYLNSLLDYLQINAKQFSESLGFDRVDRIYNVLNFKNGISPNLARTISNHYTEIDYNWLLTGEGDMLKGNERHPIQIPNDGTFRLVPLINTDAVGGMHKINDVTETDAEYIVSYIPFVDAKEQDVCIQVKSDSMIPTCPPGCVVQIREVPNWQEYFGYGNLFVIQLKDGRRIIKEVTRYDANPKDYVLCVSHNKNVPAEELPRSLIVSVWKVIRVLTDRGW